MVGMKMKDEVMSAHSLGEAGVRLQKSVVGIPLSSADPKLRSRTPVLFAMICPTP